MEQDFTDLILQISLQNNEVTWPVITPWRGYKAAWEKITNFHLCFPGGLPRNGVSLNLISSFFWPTPASWGQWKRHLTFSPLLLKEGYLPVSISPSHLTCIYQGKLRNAF